MTLTDCQGCVCEIKGLNNNLITTGVVKAVKEDLLEIGNEDGALPALNLDTKVKVIIHTGQDGGVQVLAARVYISRQTSLQLREMESYAEYEKRRFFRLAIDHSAYLMPPTGMRDAAGNRLPYRIPIRVKDLSLCGLMFESDRDFSVGDEMRVTMTMVNNEMEVLSVAIRRIISQEDGKKAYGCEIQNLSSRTEQRLNAYMLSQQQAQIRKSRR